MVENDQKELFSEARTMRFRLAEFHETVWMGAHWLSHTQVVSNIDHCYVTLSQLKEHAKRTAS